MRTAKMLPLGSGVTAMPKQLMQVSSLSLYFRSTSLRRQVLNSLLNRIVYSPSSTLFPVAATPRPCQFCALCFHALFRALFRALFARTAFVGHFYGGAVGTSVGEGGGRECFSPLSDHCR